MKEICVVGAGALGRRYIQGLAEVRGPLSMTVVEVDSDTRDIVQGQLNDMPDAFERAVIVSDIADIPGQLDLTIVSTTARNRGLICEQISERATVTNWLIEKVLTQSLADATRLQAAVDGANVWVSYPKRSDPWYLQSTKLIQAIDAPLEISLGKGNWGLACNSLHYIDLVESWRGKVCEKIVVNDGSTWIDAKRPGYVELLGSITCSWSDGTQLVLESDGAAPDVVINVAWPGGSAQINESAGVANFSTGSCFEGRESYMSELAPVNVGGILDGQGSLLPELHECMGTHVRFLQALSDFWLANKGTGLPAIT